MGLKVELINAAFSRCRISGLTAMPDNGDLTLALRRMENMAAAWEGANILTGYNFEDVPDLNSLHNVERKFWDAYESSLAMRLLSDFGKVPAPTLVKDAKGAFAVMLSATATTDQVPYPTRQPVGRGNSLRTNRFQRYYRGSAQPPNSAQTKRMTVGDIDIFTEHFDEYLRDLESIASFTIESDKPSNLFISSSSLAGADVTYTAEANVAGAYQVTIAATTSLGRVTTRVIYFDLSEA